MEKQDYQEKIDTLVTFGEEGLTLRNDDPKTKEYKDKIEKKQKEGIENGEISIWEGINLSNSRDPQENYDQYKERLKSIKLLQKLYKQLGIEECRKQFPMGFGYAINQLESNNQNKKEVLTPKPQPKMTATIDGKEVPVIVENDDNK